MSLFVIGRIYAPFLTPVYFVSSATFTLTLVISVVEYIDIEVKRTDDNHNTQCMNVSGRF